MNRHMLFALSGVLLASTALAGCAASQLTPIAAAMQTNHVDGCASITTNVAGYSGQASVCINGSATGSTVNADGGKVLMQRNGEGVAASPANSAPVAPVAPIAPK